MSKTANLYARIEPSVKERAESVLAALGLSASSAINIFYNQIILHNGLPFEVKIPDESIYDGPPHLCIDDMSHEQLEAEIQKGIDSLEKNGGIPV